MATLDPIRDAPSPNALIGALADDPALRQHGALDSLIAELVREASSPSNPYVGERRAEQAVLVLRVKGLVESVGRVTTLAELVEVYDSDDFLFVHPFWRLVEAFATDAAERQDGEGAEALTRAIAFRRQLASAAESLPTLTERSKDEIVAALRSGEILCDKAFHRWLALRHQVAARYESESAPAIARLLEWLGTVCRVVRMNDARPPLAEGSRAFHMPSDLAEAWFLVRPDLHAGFDTLLGSIGAGELSFPAAIEEIIAEHAEHEDSGQFFAAYFLERALRWSDGLLLASALQAYRILPERPGNAEVRATTALRFGSALLLYWRPAYMKKEGLDDAAQLLETAVHSVDSAKSPRLVRDLHFTRARLLENVAIWQPDRLEDARREFEAGLAIQDAAHERNARGRALGGLANVLSALSRRGVAISPGRVFGLYDEAQTLLTEKDSINRAIVLNNYAVSLLEERGADRATNVEHALTYIDEALAIATPMSDGPGWVADAIANMYLTRGNTLRERAYGALEDRLRAARDGFIQGRRYASETSELGGLLRLNQAFVCKELFTLTGEPIFEDEAYRCLVDAAERLQDRPLLSLMVSFAQGSLAEPGPTPESIATARDVVNRLRAQGHSRELAWRAHSLGGMLRRLDEKSFRDEAIALLEEALRINGELHLREEAINVARDLAAAHVAEAAPGSSGPSLAVAETYLDQAARAADELWTRVPTVEWRLSVAASSEVHADLAWVKAKRGAAIDELLRHLSLAKNRELLDHTRLLGAALEDPRRLEAREAQLVAQRAERERWLVQSAADPTVPVFDAAQRAREAIERAHDIEALNAGETDDQSAAQIRAHLASFFSIHPDASVIDLTVTQHGSVVAIATAIGFSVQTAPLTTNELIRARSAWFRAHLAWRQASFVDKPDAYAAWNKATEEILSMIAERLLNPVLDRTVLDDRHVVFVAGALGGLPLHAINFLDQRLLLRSRSISYATSLARLHDRPITWRKTPTTLCILSDPEREGRPALTESPAELARIAARFDADGSLVTVAASVRAHQGKDAFAPDALAPGVQIHAGRPTPAMIGALAPSFDAIIYSGHGFQSGLLLVDENGAAAEWGIQDVLGLDLNVKRPFVHLSACSTASETRARPNEMHSFASWLIRAGAREVLASAWEVLDSLSAYHSEVLFLDLEEGVDLRIRTAEASRLLRERVGDDDVVAWSAFHLVLAP